jgi:hypothetical protein
MKPFAIVSYPRAGYHLIDAILTNYFGYLSGRSNSGCCKGGYCFSPVSDTPLRIHRSHDFEGRTNPSDFSKIIILYRSDIISQIDAYVRYARLEAIKCNKDIPLTLEGHTTFYATDEPYNVDEVRWMYQFYNTFINKWVKTPPENSLVIDYSDLIANPTETVSTIQLFTTGTNDPVLSERIVRELCIERKNEMSESRYQALKAIIDTL